MAYEIIGWKNKGETGANQGYAGTDNRYAITKIVGYY